jgi:hypothetical protein
MPQRLIRDGLLDSEAVLSVTVEARWLYVTIILSADDLGLFEATPFRLARIADLKREHAEKLVQQLIDVDLIRTYQVGRRQLGFIPKFGQRLQIKRAKHPLPERSLLADDPDALLKVDELLRLSTKEKSPNNQRHNIKSNGESRFSTVGQPPEPEPEPELRERTRVESSSPTQAAPGPTKRGTRLPSPWNPNEAGLARAKALLGDRAGVELEKFSNFWAAKAGKDAVKLDWNRTWVNWVLQAAERSPSQKPAQGSLLDDAKPAWAIEAGFKTRFEAENEGCSAKNFKSFANGKKVTA